MLTSYTDNAPFRAAILQSGQFSYKPTILTGDATGWNAIARAFNCTIQPSIIECLRAVPAGEIRDIVEHQALYFLPIPDHVTLVTSPGFARAQGHFAKVPLMCGTNGQEARDFEVTTSSTKELLEGLFGRLAPEIIPAVAAAYRKGQPGLETSYAINTQILTDYEFDCVSSFISQCRLVRSSTRSADHLILQTVGLFANETASQGVPVWRYLFNTSFPNTQLAPHMLAFHGSEIPIVFGTYPGGPVNALTLAPEGIQRTNIPPTAREIALSRSMQSTRASFAKCPSCGPGWNPLGMRASVDVADFGTDWISPFTLIKPGDVDSRCKLYDPAYKILNGPLPGL